MHSQMLNQTDQERPYLVVTNPTNHPLHKSYLITLGKPNEDGEYHLPIIDDSHLTIAEAVGTALITGVIVGGLLYFAPKLWNKCFG